MQQSKNQVNRKMSISFLANAFNSVYIYRRKVLRFGYSHFICRAKSDRIIEKFMFISAFDLCIPAGVAQPHYAPKRD
jgi:hypothetical protein